MNKTLTTRLTQFFSSESSGGIILFIAAVFAMLLKNSFLTEMYQAILATPLQIRFGALDLNKPLLLWVNDGLMAIFFFAVGLEIKHEFLAGRLSKKSQLALPAAGALGGIIVPAGIYIAVNFQQSLSLHGWAIPTATDIAFSLAILSLLGNRVPASLKLFLLTLAILDDMAAIMTIAVFYTPSLSWAAIYMSWVALIILMLLNYFNVKRIAAYVIVGIILWICVLKSGVHATLAGVLIALCIPLGKTPDNQNTLPKQLAHDLHPWIAFCVLPLFAFMNSGIDLSGVKFESLTNPIPLGIMLGLFIGKPIGVTLFSWIVIQLKLAKLPEGVSWAQLFGVAIVCGIGFTMSLFIGSLAFENNGAGAARIDRLGIILGSLLSAVVGYTWLWFACKKTKQHS